MACLGDGRSDSFIACCWVWERLVTDSNGAPAASMEHARSFEFVTNPLMGVLMGMLASALLQSSSTVTAVIVALVASGMPVSTAIPMVMGANIGTTVTNTLVSMGHIGDKSEFRRAFAAATIHDFFNWLSVFIFLPLELAFGLLEKTSAAMVGWFHFDGSASTHGLNFVSASTKPVIAAIGKQGLLGQLNLGRAGAVVMILIGLAMILSFDPLHGSNTQDSHAWPIEGYFRCSDWAGTCDRNHFREPSSPCSCNPPRPRPAW